MQKVGSSKWTKEQNQRRSHTNCIFSYCANRKSKSKNENVRFYRSRWRCCCCYCCCYRCTHTAHKCIYTCQTYKIYVLSAFNCFAFELGWHSIRFCKTENFVTFVVGYSIGDLLSAWLCLCVCGVCVVILTEFLFFSRLDGKNAPATLLPMNWTELKFRQCELDSHIFTKYTDAACRMLHAT